MKWEHIKMHPQIGFDILSKSNKLKPISQIVLHHHERWDGNGYPHKIKEKQIPLGSRIIAVCDSIDAMMSKRPYRNPLSFEKCKHEILINKGIMYDPLIVDCFIESNINWISFLENSYKKNILYL